MATHTKDEIRERANEAQEKVESVADKAKQGAQQMADKGRDMANAAIEKGRDVASNVMEKGKEMAHSAAERAKEMGNQARERADSGVATVGSRIRSAAESIKEHAPEGGVLGSAASSLHDTLENTGRYLEEKGVSGAAEDLTGLIRRHPVPSVLVGIGLGILLGQFLTSSSRR